LLPSAIATARLGFFKDLGITATRDAALLGCNGGRSRTASYSSYPRGYCGISFLSARFLLWMLHMNFVSQFLLGGITALFLGVMIFLSNSMDRPLHGVVGVSPDSLKTVYDQVMKWDE
jgi:hypothetical protein